MTDLACAGKMELLSISHIYPHLHTERGTEVEVAALVGGLSFATKRALQREETDLLVCSDGPALC